MFRFLFKRSAKAEPSVPINQKKQVKETIADAASILAADKAAAMTAADGLAGKEAAAADFVMQCKFAEARLQAANHVHSKELLESLVQAMRDTDRRVVKLAQQRLDAIKQRESAERKATECVERIEVLAKEPVILSNRLSEIDRSWEVLHGIPQDLIQRFEHGRAALQQRLLEQTALQRTMIELRNGVHDMVSALERASPRLSTEMFSSQLDAFSEQFAQACAAPEAPSLPKSLAIELETMIARARQLLEQLARRKTAITAHEQAYSAWEADPAAISDLDALRRELRSLPVLIAEDAQFFDQRFENLQARIAKANRPIAVKAEGASTELDMAKHRRSLQALEQALEEGALQLAVEQEKELRTADHPVLKWKNEEVARLANARAELNRLKSWARWGGKVSREELVKAAEELPNKEDKPSELAKKIGSLRAQWKSMDVTAGPADKETWRRFDAACTAAYVPVAAHFHALAVERQANLEKAQSLIAQLKEFIASEIQAVETDAVDWKKAAAFRAHMLQAWRSIGPVERKEKKQLDKQFTLEMDALSGPLTEAQQQEVTRRQSLIEQVTHLDPADKKSMTILRQLQQQWQQYAKLLPLERKDEQSLWLRFRAACDDYVARRNANLQQTDAQYTENRRRKSALCERLELEASGLGKNLESLLNDVAQQWDLVGPVARTDEQTLNERYRRAVSLIHSRLAREKQAARRKEFGQVRKKLALCMAAEESVNAGVPKDVGSLESEWQVCDTLPEPFESLLSMRFRSALEAAQSGDAPYAARLKQNRSELERDLLRLEISLDIESAPELAAERLKLQVEALQASLKSGNRITDRMTMLRKLCQLPALPDAASRARIERLFERLETSED